MIKSEFTYWPSVRMFCSRTWINLINKTHKYSLRLILNDHESSLMELLRRENNDMINHKRNIQMLLIVILKTTKNLAPAIIEGMFNA